MIRPGVSTTEFGIVIGLVALASLQALTLLGDEVEQNIDTSRQTVAESEADPFARARASRNEATDPNEPGTAGARMAPSDSGSETISAPMEPVQANSPPMPYGDPDTYP